MRPRVELSHHACAIDVRGSSGLGGLLDERLRASSEDPLLAAAHQRQEWARHLPPAQQQAEPGSLDKWSTGRDHWVVDLFGFSQTALRRFLVATGVSSKFIPVRGHSIHVYQVEGKGSGPPVLLVHGLGGSANGFFRIFSGLAKRFSRVIALDLPGHGYSPLPVSGPAKLLEQLAILKEAASLLSPQPAYVVGNSLGGAMSLLLAHELPEQVRALALISPGGARMEREQLLALGKVMHVKTTAESRALTRRIFHRAPLAALAFASELRKMYGTPAVLAAFEEIDQHSHVEPHILSAIRAPVLLLWGQSDRLLPQDGVHYFRAHLPASSRIEIVPGFGHVPQVERPGAVVKRLVQFADELGL